MHYVKRTVTSLALIMTVLVLVPLVSWAKEVPALKGRVNDYANMISPAAEQQIEQVLASLERSDSTQIVVLTVDSLEGDALEPFSIRVAEKWKIGQKGFDNGAILLVSKQDRKIRIEVGYGLEATLTDLVSGRIIDNIITPNFKQGNFDRGFIDAVNAMAGVVKGEFTADDIPKRESRGSGGKVSTFLIFAIIVLIMVLGSQKKLVSGIGGAIFFPIIGLAVLNLGLFALLVLIPAGFILGLLLPVFFGGGVGGGYHGGGGFTTGGFGGGFGGGGFGGGGFSGGGGGFGGGGASGGW